MDKDRIFHVYPINDDNDHLLETEYDMANQLKCRCMCKPKLEFHRSYDGYLYYRRDYNTYPLMAEKQLTG